MSKAIHIRTSTTLQSPEIQLRDIGTIVPLNECLIFTEQDSAWKESVNRPVLEDVKKQIKQGKISELYAWDLDRLFRNRNRLKEFMAYCKSYGCKIHTYRQPWLNEINNIPNPWGDIMYELLLNIFGWIAEEESDKKSERVKNSVKHTKNGTVSHKGNRWGRKPFPKQTVDRVTELSKQGLSIRQIANQLVVYDKNKNERKMSKSAVHKILAQITAEKGRLNECP